MTTILFYFLILIINLLNFIYMDVKIVNKSNHQLPSYATASSAGMDLKANILEPIVLKPMERYLFPTGIYIQLPEGYEAQIRPRSGLALKNGISIVNSPGTIDSDYRGDIGIILINHGFEPFMVEQGDRIAQMVITQHTQVEFVEVEELSDTDRGDGGFGHTGTM